MLTGRQGFNIELLDETAVENCGIEMRKQYKGQKHHAANQGTIEQNGDDGIVDDGLFLEDVVEAQKDGRDQ